MRRILKETGDLCSNLWLAVSQDSGFKNIGKLFLAILVIGILITKIKGG